MAVNLLRRSQSSVYTGVRCPYLDDNDEIDMPDPGTAVSTQELYYWMEQDFPGVFGVHMLTDEALAFWTIDNKPHETSPDEQHRDRITMALKYARALGFAVVVYYDEQNDLSAPLIEGQPTLGFDVFPPRFETYGIEKWDLDAENRPEWFYISYGDKAGKKLKISAKRCTIITCNRTTPDWRGLALLAGCADDVRDYWRWRRILGERAGTRATTRYMLNKQQGTWTSDEITSVNSAFAGVPCATVVGATIQSVSGDLGDTEIVNILDALREAIAVKLGVNVSDFRGAEAGQKLSVDSNNTRLARTLRGIQNWATPFMEEIYARMGWSFKGLNPPWEIPPDVLDKSALALIDAMENTMDEDIKKILKGRVLAIYRGIEPEELNEIEREPTPYPGTGGFGEGGDEFRDGGSPADRSRDRSTLNRTRQDNAAPAR